MDQRGFALLLVRMAGLLIVAFGFLNLPLLAAEELRSLSRSLTGHWDSRALIQFLGFTLAPSVISMVFGLIVFRSSERIVGRFFASAKAETSDGTVDLTAIEEVGVAILGFYFLADGLTFAIRDLTSASILRLQDRDWALVPNSIFLDLFSDAIRMVIGIGFLWGSRTIVAARRKFASAE